MSIQLLLCRPGRSVDALQHRPLLVTTPVGAGDREELEGSDLPRAGHMGTAAEIEELALLVGRNDFVLRKALDQLDLIGVVAKYAQGFFARDHLALERFRFLAVGRHATLDLREVVRRQWSRQVEVIVEAVLDGGT